MNPFAALTSLWGFVPRVRVVLGRRLGFSMQTGLAIAVYTVLGAALVAATLWYVQAVRLRFFAADKTPAIAPVSIIGTDDTTAKSYATGLPAMIVAATNDLKLRANAAIRTLTEAKNELAQSQKPVEEVDLPVPSEFRQELTIDLKIADVEVGPLLSFLLEHARDPNVLQLTVALGADKKTSEVYGFLPGKGSYAFAVTSTSELPAIARAIAAQLVHRAAQGGESAFAALDAPSFQQTVEALEAYARLTFAQRWILATEGSPTTARDRLRSEYAAVLAKITDTAQRYSGWEGLQWLAAQTARNAGDWAAALGFYSNLKILAERARNEPLLGRLALAMQDTEHRIADKQAITAAAERGELISFRSTAATVLSGEPTRRVLTAIGLKAPGSAPGVTIGIVGAAPWPEAIAGSPVEVLGGAAADIADESLRDYQTTVWQTVRLVAPDAKFVFAPIHGGTVRASAVSLIYALDSLVTRRPDIVLLTFGSSQGDQVINNAIRRVAETVLVVAAAGNEPGKSGYEGVADIAAVAAVAGPDGAPAPFTSTVAQAVWAPGVDIPVISVASGEAARRSGSSYAAAIVAGAAALLKEANPQATPVQLRATLLATSKPAPGREQPAIIDVSAALAQLKPDVGG